MRTAVTALCLLLILTSISSAREGPRSLLGNGSFERVVPAGAMKDGGHGAWKVGADGNVPAGWTLNTVYPGTMAVVGEGAADGERCIRVTGGAKPGTPLRTPAGGSRQYFAR